MNLLLDTHAFLWLVWGDERLSARAKDAIAVANTEVFVSAATVWEISIKTSIGKLDLRTEPMRFINKYLAAYRFTPLPITIEHAAAIHKLPPRHSDPFDRLLAAQARSEKLMLVTSDETLTSYPIKTLW